jgi:hypothetical protein
MNRGAISRSLLQQLPFRQQDKSKKRPEPEDNTKNRPQIFRITMVVSEQSTYQAVKKMDHGSGANQHGEGQVTAQDP